MNHQYPFDPRQLYSIPQQPPSWPRPNMVGMAPFNMAPQMQAGPVPDTESGRQRYFEEQRRRLLSMNARQPLDAGALATSIATSLHVDARAHPRAPTAPRAPFPGASARPSEPVRPEASLSPRRMEKPMNMPVPQAVPPMAAMPMGDGPASQHRPSEPPVPPVRSLDELLAKQFTALAPTANNTPRWMQTLPLVYMHVEEAATQNGLIDTARLYPILLCTGVPRHTLAALWSHVNRRTPGQLQQDELYLLLAGVALFQQTGVLPDMDTLRGLAAPPEPHFPGMEFAPLEGTPHDASHSTPATDSGDKYAVLKELAPHSHDTDMQADTTPQHNDVQPALLRWDTPPTEPASKPKPPAKDNPAMAPMDEWGDFVDKEAPLHDAHWTGPPASSHSTRTEARDDGVDTQQQSAWHWTEPLHNTPASSVAEWPSLDAQQHQPPDPAAIKASRAQAVLQDDADWPHVWAEPPPMPSTWHDDEDVAPTHDLDVQLHKDTQRDNAVFPSRRPGKPRTQMAVLEREPPPEAHVGTRDEPKTDTHEDECVHAWLRCLRAAIAAVESASTAVAGASPQALQQVSRAKKGMTFVQGVKQVVLVCDRIRKAVRARQESHPEMDALWAHLQQMRSNLEPLVDTTHLQDDDDEGGLHACALCTQPVSSGSLSYARRHYHCACANLWLNWVEPVLPTLQSA